MVVLKGFLIGLSIAAPVGPIGVLCIRRTLTDGRLVGLVTGLGAASADAVYGSMAAFGLTLVTGFLVAQENILRIVGGLFLLYLGIRTFLSHPSDEPASAERKGLQGAYLSTFFLTLTNPLTILSFAAIFAGLGLATEERGLLAAILLILGVFLGSASWWLFLSGAVSLFRNRFDLRAMTWVNRISGSIIFGFGVAAFLI
jgi:threonine/homoserine/homoserine lactone efflux protein